MFCTQCGQRVDDAARFCHACGAVLRPGAATGTPVAVPGAVSPPVVAPSALHGYAGFWRRLAAALIDGVILAAGNVVAGAAVYMTVYAFNVAVGAWSPRQREELTVLLIWVTGVVLAWLYFALLESSAGRSTFGKRVLGILVTDLRGGRASFGRATGRHFAKLVSLLTLFIGFLMAAFTARKQALHDLMAGCLVVRRS